MDRQMGEWGTTALPLEVFTQRNCVAAADVTRLKLNFIFKKQKSLLATI